MSQTFFQKQTSPSNSFLSWFILNQRSLFLWGLPATFLFCFLYLPTLQWLFTIWSHDKPYSHGFLVPLIVFYLVWIKREQLKKIRVQSCWWVGGTVLLACFLLLLLGRIGAVIQLEVLSLYFFFPGVVLFLWGWSMLKALWFPLLYLQFMIPWIDPFLNYVYPVFRQLAATLGTWFLSFIYPVMQDGTFVQLPDISLSVVNACSGINFFISVTAIGILLAYLTQKSWTRVSIVLIAGGALTILANGFRIALAGIMGQEFGVDMLHGPGHIFRGWFVAQVGWVGIFFVNWLIARIPHSSTLYLYERWRGESGTQEKRAEEANRENGKTPLVVLVVFLMCFGSYLNFFALPRPIRLSVDLATVPLNISEWKGRAVGWLNGNEFFPGVNQEILRKYRSPSGQSVYLYIGYFTHQTVDARLVSFRARPLFKNVRECDIFMGDSAPLKVNLSTPVISSIPYKVLSWYQFVDGELADVHKVKFKAITDALVHHRNNGAVILVALPALRGSNAYDVPDDLAAFSQLVAPILKNIIRGSHMGSM